MNESFIKDIGRSYIVSSLLPATFFVLLAVVLFRGFVPQILTENLIVGKDTVSTYSAGALLIAFILWVAFALYSSVDFVIKLYEGYYFPFFISMPLKFIQYLLQQFKIRHYRQYELKTEEIKLIKRKKERNEEWEKLNKIMPKVRAELHPRGLAGPLDNDWEQFLPTRLGNILRASEIYPVERYELHAPELFNKLSVLLPQEFQVAFEEKDNQLDFILNSSLLSYFVGLISITLGTIGHYGWFSSSVLPNIPDQNNFLAKGFSLISADNYLWIGAGFLVVGYLIYCLSINLVTEYSMFVRSSFDLYRFRLLKELNQPLPKTLSEERGTWSALSDFFVAGERLGEVSFSYQFTPEFTGESGKTNSTSSPSTGRK